MEFGSADAFREGGCAATIVFVFLLRVKADHAQLCATSRDIMLDSDNHVFTGPTADALRDELCSIITRNQQRVALGELGLLEAEDCPVEAVRSKATLDIMEIGKRMPDIIIHDERFPGNKVLMVRKLGGALGFYPNFIAAPLVRRVLQTGDPDDAIRWLQKVLGTTAADGQCVLALWGVPVERRIELTPRVAIVPMDGLPESKQKQLVTNLWYQHTAGPFFSSLHLTPPESALVVGDWVEPFFYTPDEDNLTDGFAAKRKLLSEIALVLTAVGPRVPLEAACWFNFDDPDLEQASSAQSFYVQSFIEVLPLRPQVYPPLDPVEAPRVVQNYLAMQEAVRGKVRVALQRLSQAQRRHNFGDQAVELSIALEALMGDTATTEITHRIAVRSARMLGGDGSVRAKNGKVIKDAYKIRSQTVHGQAESRKGRETEKRKIIDRTLEICIELVKTIIQQKAIPDWNTFDYL